MPALCYVASHILKLQREIVVFVKELINFGNVILYALNIRFSKRFYNGTSILCAFESRHSFLYLLLIFAVITPSSTKPVLVLNPNLYIDDLVSNWFFNKRIRRICVFMNL